MVGLVEFTVGSAQVIEGLDEGVSLLRLGDEADIICSPTKAYGDAGQPPFIPRNSHVVCAVKILAVIPESSHEPATGPAILLSRGMVLPVDRNYESLFW